MNKYLQQHKEFIKDGVILLLFFLYFRSNIAWAYNYFTQTAVYEYTILFFVALFILLVSTKDKYSFKNKNVVSLRILTLLFGAVIFDLFNVFFLRYQIISATAMILAGYAILGMYLEGRTWKRGLFIVGIIALSLPFTEHIQTFLGFPIRLLTAKVVSTIMGLLGLVSVSDAVVIITENNATSIDVPCSGIKSIYTGIIVLLTILFLKKAGWSLRLLGIAIAYFLLLLLFNIWRVFSLVYIYDVIHYPAFGNAIHVGIGIIGFIVSTVALWYAVEKYVPCDSLRTNEREQKGKFYRKYPIIILLIAALVLDTAHIAFSASNDTSIQRESIVFSVENLKLDELPFTTQEEEFFVNREVQFSKKYQGKTTSGLEFSLLVISSNSSRTHHNPELCLQGTGHKIDKSEIVQLGDLRLRKLSLNDGEDTVYYWFVAGDKTVMDYSERVWEGMKSPNAVWTLVEVGFKRSADLSNTDIAELIMSLHSRASEF